MELDLTVAIKRTCSFPAQCLVLSGTGCCVCSHHRKYNKVYCCWLPLQVLTHPEDDVAKVWLEDCRHSFAQMIHDKLTRDAEEAKTKVSADAWSGQISDGCHAYVTHGSGPCFTADTKHSMFCCT